VAGPPSEGSGTGRVEAFSDGVFAIAVTLLVLDIHVPRLDEGANESALWHALRHQWPVYLAYATSFATILIMWVNHHTIFRCVRRTDHALLLLNGVLLACITLVPFPPDLLAEYARRDGRHVAAACYAGTFVLIAISFNLLWRYVAHHGRLLHEDINPEFLRSYSRSYLFAPPLYLTAFLAAFINVALTVGICILLALLFALPNPAHRLPSDA
jgi:uncharacterized membrane protein